MTTPETSTEAKAATGEETRPKRKTRRRAVEELVRSYFEAIEQRDPERAGDYWDPEGVEDIAPIGVFRGRERIKAFFAELLAASPDLETTITRVVADEKRAVVEWRMSGHFTGAPFQGIDPNGKRIELRGADLFEVADGKLKSNTSYYDGMDFARQVGLMPAQDSGAERALKGAFNTFTRARKVVNERIGR